MTAKSNESVLVVAFDGLDSELLSLYRKSLSKKPLLKTLGAIAVDLPRGVIS